MISRARTIATPLLSLLVLLLVASPAIAQKTISGAISTNTTLDTVGGAVYEVTATVTVSSGVTLTIDPGVTLKFNPSTHIEVAGTLFAEGGSAADSLIVFTSIKDDTAPPAAPEDTNLDGAATTPATGDWRYIQFNGATASASSMRWCVMRYTGQSSYAAIYVSNSAAPLIRACDISSGYEGIRIRTSSAPTIRNTTVTSMTTVPYLMQIGTAPVFENLILPLPSGNAYDAIQLFDGNVFGSANLPLPNATIGGFADQSLSYWVTDNIDIGAGETLTIDPGAVLKFSPNISINNSGLLTALGGTTADSLIYFTSIDDDNVPTPVGQDTNTNGNATFPDWQDWGGVRFFDSSDDLSKLRNVHIRFAGYNGSTYASVYCADASPSIVNCDLTAGYYGVKCVGVSKPLLKNSSVNAMQDVPVAIEISSDPVFDSLVFESTSDNGFDAIGILGGTLTGTNRLTIRGALLGGSPIDNLTYILLADVTVAVSGTLTIDPGVVAKPRANVDIFVDGTLNIDGTADPDSQIVFTSYKDDNFGDPSDTNNDGSITAPDKGDWGKIQYNAGSFGSVSYATLRFGGASNGAILLADSASPTFAELTISDTYYGIQQSGTAASSITNVDISNTTYTPVRMSISADPTYSGITFTNVGLSAIGLIPETVGVNSVLRVRNMAGYSNITYYLAGDINVAVGAHFRIEPGIVLKMATGGYGYDLNIAGSMRAVGTVDSTIAFTGINDDSRGNPLDTAGDGANSPAASNWGYLKFESTSIDAACVVERCELAYGGYGYSSAADAVIWCNSSSPTIRNNQFVTNYIGVWTDGSATPLIQDNHFFNHSTTPLATSVVANATYVGNTFDQNGIHAVGLINETLATDATLEKIAMAGYASYPYYNLGTTLIGTGTTLTIEPGVLVKARDYSNPFECSGSLIAVGLVSDRIIFTTIRDDSLGGDSNVDGGATTTSAGNWNGIRFYDSTIDGTARIENTLFRFAGYTYAIELNSASPTIIANEFELCTYAIRMLNTSNPVIQDNLFRVLTWYPIEKSIIAAPTFSGNTLDNVNYHCIAIRGESIGQDMTLQKWDFAGYTNITQVLTVSTINVQLGATLTVEPGVVLKMLSQSYTPFSNRINVYGSLIADGTALDPIVFTSVKDDTAGNPADTNTDGSATTPARGNWSIIYFDEVSNDATAILDHCELRWGGNGMAYASSASPTISDCSFDQATYGIYLTGTSAPSISNCTIDNMTYSPVAMSLVSDPTFTGNQFLSGNGYNGLGIIGETLAQDVTIRSRNVAQTARTPYVLLGSLTAGFSSILRVEPGVIIKSPSTSYNITIRRGLVAEGGAGQDEQIVFTSITDDTYGGDTNNDGTATSPGSSRWGRILIQNEAIDDSTRFDNVVFRYGYSNSTYGTIEINSANPKFDNCVFAYNGVAVDYKGISGDPAKGWIHNSDFYGNTYYGVRNQGTAFTVDATSNWWGHASGPLDSSDDTGSGGFYNPTGLGDPVSDRVDYGSWLTSGIVNVLLGDTSRNGDVRAYDASLVLQELVAPGLLGPLQLVLGDVNCSGTPTALDASLILRYVAGIDSHFPCAVDSVATRPAPDARLVPGEEPITFQLSLPAVSLAAAQSQWVPIQLSGGGDLYGQEYHVTFDPAQLSVQNVRLLPSAAGSAMSWNVINGNELRIALASVQPLQVVDAVEFQIVGDVSLQGTQPISLSLDFARLNEQVYEPATGTGKTPQVTQVELYGNAPNPFNPKTEIRYALPESLGNVEVRLEVFDLKGRLVRVLVRETQGPGPHVRSWDGRDELGRQVSSGVYFYRLVAGEVSKSAKMLLLK